MLPVHLVQGVWLAGSAHCNARIARSICSASERLSVAPVCTQQAGPCRNTCTNRPNFLLNSCSSLAVLYEEKICRFPRSCFFLNEPITKSAGSLWLAAEDLRKWCG